MGAVSSRPRISPRPMISRRSNRSGSPTMIELWWSEAEKHNVLPLDDRFGPRFAENAARFHGARNSFTSSTPAWAMCRPTSRRTCAAAATPSRPMSRSTRRAEGVLIAHGDATSGYSLYVKDGLLVHDLNIGGGHEIVTSNRKIAAGRTPARRACRASGAQGAAGQGIAHRGQRIYAADRRRAGGLAADPARLPQFDLVVRASTSAATAAARCRITTRRSNSPGGCCR